MAGNAFRHIVLVLFICTASLSGQVSTTINPVVDSLNDRGDLLVARWKFSGARDLYETVLEKDENSVPALIGMGKVELAGRSWSGAIKWCEKALELDANNLDVCYLLGSRGTQNAAGRDISWRSCWDSSQKAALRRRGCISEK